MDVEQQSRLADFRRGLARYTPLVRLASGGMGEVWRGEASFPDGYVEPVAIKRVLPHLACDPLYRRMLEDEARLGMMLKHPNIVRVYDARSQGSFILVMEYVHGLSLYQVLERLRERPIAMPVPAALHIARKLASALEHAHEALDEWGRELAIVHGDLSPHNVLLSLDGEVKLMDFGLARASANLVVPDPKKVRGKYGYLAPELVLRRESSQLVDLFALGIVLWECLTGRRLFQARSFEQSRTILKRCEVPAASLFNGEVTPEIELILLRALAKKPEDRYQSARALGIDLDRVLEAIGPSWGAAAAANVARACAAQKNQRNRSTVPPVEQPAIEPSRLAELKLTEDELESFFASCDTSVYQQLPPAPRRDADAELDSFLAACDTGLFKRPGSTPDRC